MTSKYAYVKESMIKRKEWVDSLKSGPCSDCGQSYPPYVMQWHHLDPTTKKFGIGSQLYRQSRKAILEEVSKCVLLCANCHCIREHYMDTHSGKAWS